MYDKQPFVPVGEASECCVGWESIRKILSDMNLGTVCVECYPGAFQDELEAELGSLWPAAKLIRTLDAFLPEETIVDKFAHLITGDPVFGLMSATDLSEFFDQEKLQSAREQAQSQSAVVIGPGASLITSESALLIYADLARWEIQQRQRKSLIPNLGMNNLEETALLKYKRAFFLDWRAADRLKSSLFARIDFLLDTNIPSEPKMISGATFRRGLHKATLRPFRVVPFFDPGPWGGHWMEKVCDLPDDGASNHAWCFDCVPEENSLLLGFGDQRVEVPALDVVLYHPHELLGDKIVAEFGAEFPIRFDLLDTMGGGNLSLQVHPLTAYIRSEFGMAYTQDESYYMLDASAGATVYLGLKEGIDPAKMAADLARAQEGIEDFPAEEYVNQFPAHKHDHFLIPAGTIHCSGKDSMVLEISATPYIFTFKLWDWGRLGMDGRPRPIHLEHGLKNIQWDRTTRWVESNLVNQIEAIDSGDGWREERTGLHSLQFIETRRHWFTKTVTHDTRGTVHVLNLVEGLEAVVESPVGAFEPFVVHYAESFIVPAAIGQYTIRPHGPSIGKLCATMLAYVR